MRIFVSHAKQGNYERDLYQPLRESGLFGGYTFFLPHEDGRAMKTKEEIQTSSLMVAEVSFPAIGVGIEIGWADAAHIPLLCIYRKGVNISRLLKYLTDDFIEYASLEELINSLSAYVHSEKFYHNSRVHV